MRNELTVQLLRLICIYVPTLILIIKSFVGSEKGDILENIWARFS